MINRQSPTKDGIKYKSRKFLLSILGLVLITGVGTGALFSSAVTAIYPTFIGGILGVLSLYFTGNVVAHHVHGKNAVVVNNIKQDSNEEGEE